MATPLFEVFPDPLPTSPPPRAIVLLLGWLGAKPRSLTKYSELYQAGNCVTLQGTASSVGIISYDHAYLRTFLRQAISEVMKIWKMYDSSTPIILHAFSNGGAFVIAEVLFWYKHSDEEIDIFRNHLAGYVFDSAPVFVTSPKTGMKAVAGNFPPGSAYRWPATAAAALWLYGYKLLIGDEVHRIFRHNILNSNAYPYNQAFIYSATDSITPVADVEETISARRALNERDGKGQIITVKLEQSEHVDHLRKYPTEYRKFVEQVLNTFVGSHDHSFMQKQYAAENSAYRSRL